jgi:multiple sugar transport system ATP-binding protein
MDSDNFTLTIKDVAKFLKISQQMVYNLVKDSRIKAFKIGSSTRILYSDLNEYIRLQKEELSKKLSIVSNDYTYFSIKNICLVKDKFTLNNISFSFPIGKTTAIIGPSGSGKTLLLRSICGLEILKSGSIFFSGRRLDNLEPKNRNMGFVFQNYALFPNMNLKKNIKFPLIIDNSNKNLAETETSKRINEFNINTEYLNNLPKTLPEGMKQLTAIAREKNHEIDIFLLDEPMSNLDMKIHIELRIFLKKFIRDFSKTTIITLNNPEDALSMSDYLAVMDNGNLIQFGETFEVYNNPVSKLVMEETTRTNLISLDADVINGLVKPYDLKTDKEDGAYSLCFRADEIELLDSGIEANIISKTFYDGKRQYANCSIKNGNEIGLLLPLDVKDKFHFKPANIHLFKK